MTLTPGGDHLVRHRLLGCSVVPAAAKYAYLHMYRGSQSQSQKSQPQKSQSQKSQPSQHRRLTSQPEPARFPRHGVATAAGAGMLVLAEASPPALRPPADLDLHLNPGAYKAPVPPSTLLTTAMVTAPIRKRLWATPTSNTTHAANYLTVRSEHALLTEVRFERRTPDALRGGQVTPEFVEWLMGIPVGWTAVKRQA
jgi:hypothetical protein